MDCIRNTFISAGWVLSPTKCVFESGVTSLALLGFLISTTPVLTIDLSTPRKTKLLELLDVAIAAPATTLANPAGENLWRSSVWRVIPGSLRYPVSPLQLYGHGNGPGGRQGFVHLAHPPYTISGYHGGVDPLAYTTPR